MSVRLPEVSGVVMNFVRETYGLFYRNNLARNLEYHIVAAHCMPDCYGHIYCGGEFLVLTVADKHDSNSLSFIPYNDFINSMQQERV